MANTDYTKVNVQQLSDLASTIQTSSSNIQSGLTNYNNLLKSLQSSGYLEGVSTQAINQSYSKIMNTYEKFAEYATEVVKQLNSITQETQNIEQTQASAWQDIVGSDPLNFGAALGAVGSAIGATLGNNENGDETTTTGGTDVASEASQTTESTQTEQTVSTGQTSVPSGMTPKLNNWITELEGTGPGTTTINGKEYYKAYADNGTYAASKGVQVIDNNGNKYLSNDAYLNQDGVIYVEKNAVDGLYNQEIISKKNQVIAAANEHNVSLNEDQVNALTSYVYRTGTGRGQHEEAIIAYAEGGNEGLRDCMYSHASSTGAKKRVQAEYTLFTTGVYTDNPYDQPLQS